MTIPVVLAIRFPASYLSVPCVTNSNAVPPSIEPAHRSDVEVYSTHPDDSSVDSGREPFSHDPRVGPFGSLDRLGGRESRRRPAEQWRSPATTVAGKFEAGDVDPVLAPTCGFNICEQRE